MQKQLSELPATVCQSVRVQRGEMRALEPAYCPSEPAAVVPASSAS